MLLLSLASMLVVVPLLGIVAPLILMIVAVRYCCQTLYYAAMGEKEVPLFADHGSGTNFFLKLVLIYIILYGAVGLLFAVTGNLAIAVVASLLVQLLMPAATMSLAIDQELGRAVNPVLLTNIAIRIGAPYLVLWAFVSLLLGAMYKIPIMLMGSVPIWQIAPITTFFSLYFMIAAYHLMGYVAYQYHEQLGFMPTALENSNFGQDNEENKIYTGVDDLIEAGQAYEAIELLKTEVRANPEDFGLQERLNLLFLLSRLDNTLALQQATAYIRRLMNDGQKRHALEVYRRSVKVLGQIPIADANQALELARQAQSLGDGRTALALLARFDERFSGHPQVPEAYLLSAQLLIDVMNKDEAARKLLLNLQQTYPDHHIQPRVRQHLDMLDKLNSPPVQA